MIELSAKVKCTLNPNILAGCDLLDTGCEHLLSDCASFFGDEVLARHNHSQVCVLVTCLDNRSSRAAWVSGIPLPPIIIIHDHCMHIAHVTFSTVDNFERWHHMCTRKGNRIIHSIHFEMASLIFPKRPQPT